MKDLHKLSDTALLSLMSNDDAEAFRQLFLRHNRSLYGTAYSKLHDREVAKDVVQDVFATLWQKRAEIRLRNGEGALSLWGFPISCVGCFGEEEN